MRNNKSAFTIVELLVVIVVIGILAAITVVSYSGVQNKAIVSNLQSELDQNSKQLKMYNVEYGYYPSALDEHYCPTTPKADNRYCLKASQTTILSYSGGGQVFSLVDTHSTSKISYKITENSAPTAYSVADSFIKTSGTTSGDQSSAVIELDDGSLIAVGETASVGSGDGSIQKYSSAGTLLWSKTFGSATGAESTNEVIKTSDGGFATTGTTNGFGATGNDVFLAKFNANGDLQWSRTWGNTSDDRGYSIAQSSDGYLYTGGYTVSNDAIVLKYDLSGNFVWNRIIATSGDDTSVGMTATDDNGVVFVGQGSSSGIRFDRMSSDGTLVWDKIWDGSGLDRLSCVIKAKDGGFIATGYSNSFESDYKSTLVKFSSDGVFGWMKTIDAGSNSEDGGGVLESDDGGIVVVGNTKSVGSGLYDVYLSKLDSAGNFVWAKTFGGTGNEYVSGRIFKTSDNGYAFAGVTNSGDISFGGNDMFVAKYKVDGTINNCPSTYCKSHAFTLVSRTPTFNNGGSTNSNPGTSIKTDATASTVTGSYSPSTRVIAAP